MDDLRTIYKLSIDEALKFLSIKSPTEVDQESESFIVDIHLSIETYLLHLLHVPLSSHLSIKFAHKDAVLNRCIRYCEKTAFTKFIKCISFLYPMKYSNIDALNQIYSLISIIETSHQLYN